MSETAPEPRPDGQRGQGKKILGLPRNQAIGLGLVAAGGLLFLIWRARKNAAAAASTGGTTTGTCPDGSAPDANGNCPQDSTDMSGQLGTLQSEIGDLQGELAGGGAGGVGAGTVDGSTGTTTTPTGSTAASGSSASPGTTATAGSGTGSAANWKFPAPAALKVLDKAKNGYRLEWDAVRGPSGQIPTGYTVATYTATGTEVDNFVATSTNTAEYGKGGKGLPKGTYHTNVWANGGPVAPPHADTGPVILTG